MEYNAHLHIIFTTHNKIIVESFDGASHSSLNIEFVCLFSVVARCSEWCCSLRVGVKPEWTVRYMMSTLPVGRLLATSRRRRKNNIPAEPSWWGVRDGQTAQMWYTCHVDVGQLKHFNSNICIHLGLCWCRLCWLQNISARLPMKSSYAYLLFNSCQMFA